MIYGACTFATKNAGGVYYVKSFKIYQPLKNEDLANNMKLSKDIDMVFSAETAHSSKNKEWWYIEPKTNVYLNDGSVKVAIPEGGGSAFYFKPDKTSIKIKDYSKIVITLSANEDNRKIRLGLSTDNNLLFDEKNAYDDQGKSTTGTANTDSVFEIDLTKIDTQDADIYGILIGEAWTKDVEVTIKSIKLIAK